MAWRWEAYGGTGAIATFEPRPVLVPSKRVPGMKWLNGPLVWAVDESVDFMYLFPATLPAHPHMGNRANEQRGQDRAAAYVEQAGIWTKMFDGGWVWLEII